MNEKKEEITAPHTLKGHSNKLLWSNAFIFYFFLFVFSLCLLYLREKYPFKPRFGFRLCKNSHCDLLWACISAIFERNLLLMWSLAHGPFKWAFLAKYKSICVSLAWKYFRTTDLNKQNNSILALCSHFLHGLQCTGCMQTQLQCTGWINHSQSTRLIRS